MTSYHEGAAMDDIKNKRQQILDAAYQVFSRKGYHLATVDEIIALADTGKGTVYNYFNNKEQLFYTVIREISDPFEKTLHSVVKAEQAPIEKIKSIIVLFLDFYTKNADLWRVMMHEVRGFGSEGYSHFKEEQREKYRTRFCETIGLVEQVLKEAIDAGVVKDCNVSQVAFGLFSVIITLVFQNMVGDDILQTADNIADMLLNGIAKK